MDAKLLQNFKEKIFKLQSSSDVKAENGSSLTQDEFTGAILTLVTEDIAAERFCRVKEIMGAKNPLILACKSNSFWKSMEKDPEKSFDFVNIRKRSKTSSSSNRDQNSMCGSPLKLDIIADLSVFEGDVTMPVCSTQSPLDCGLSQNAARRLLSLYSNLFSSTNDEVIVARAAEAPSLIVLCDGQNLKSVSGMCLKPVIDKQNNFIGVKITEVSSKHAAEKSSHAKLHPKFATTDILCEAKYSIMTEVGDKLQADLQSSLRLELEWRKIVGQSVLLLHDPPTEAKAVVRIQVTAGNMRSPAFSVYQELEILRAMIQGLATTEVNWIGTQEHPLVDAVKDLIEQLKLGSDVVEYKLGESSQEEDYNTGFDSILLEERKDLDFTDHLWKILQHCTSYSELVDSFNYVIKMLRTGDLQPFIHNYNSTTVAQMVKDSYRGQLRAPSMSGLSPLQYLAEMGIQKLTQDYIHIFLSKNLTSLGNLEFFVKGNLELEDKMERLGRLQNTLEVVIMLKQCLNLPHATLTESTRQMLKHYESCRVDQTHHFVFPVPTSALSLVLENYTPSEWKAQGVKMVEGVPERLTYHFTTEQPFDWLKLDSAPNSKGSSGDTEEPSYFLTLLKDSVSILC